MLRKLGKHFPLCFGKKPLSSHDSLMSSKEKRFWSMIVAVLWLPVMASNVFKCNINDYLAMFWKRRIQKHFWSLFLWARTYIALSWYYVNFGKCRVFKLKWFLHFIIFCCKKNMHFKMQWVFLFPICFWDEFFQKERNETVFIDEKKAEQKSVYKKKNPPAPF